LPPRRIRTATPYEPLEINSKSMMENTATSEMKFIVSSKALHLSSAKNSLSRALSANRQGLSNFDPTYSVAP
jgi:hypothetical protein